MARARWLPLDACPPFDTSAVRSYDPKSLELYAQRYYWYVASLPYVVLNKPATSTLRTPGHSLTVTLMHMSWAC